MLPLPQLAAVVELADTKANGVHSIICGILLVVTIFIHLRRGLPEFLALQPCGAAQHSE